MKLVALQHTRWIVCSPVRVETSSWSEGLQTGDFGRRARAQLAAPAARVSLFRPFRH